MVLAVASDLVAAVFVVVLLCSATPFVASSTSHATLAVVVAAVLVGARRVLRETTR